MTTYEMQIIGVLCGQVDGKSNVVQRIDWAMDANDGQNTERFLHQKQVAYDPNGPFTNFKDITKEQMMGWLVAALGDEHIQIVKDHLDELLAQKIAPVVTAPKLPWME
jgi:hypothetical protein